MQWLLTVVTVLCASTAPSAPLIRGHGPLSDWEDLVAYRSMLQDVRDRVSAGIAAGQSLPQIQAAKPTAGYDAPWGTGFIKPDKFVEIVYQSLSGS